jgi:hypothetical protein
MAAAAHGWGLASAALVGAFWAAGWLAIALAGISVFFWGVGFWGACLLDRENTRLREQLDGAQESSDGWQAALAEIADLYEIGPAARIARQALAGTDTPAGSPECEHDWVREHGSAESFCLVCGAGPVPNPEEER